MMKTLTDKTFTRISLFSALLVMAACGGGQATSGTEVNPETAGRSTQYSLLSHKIDAIEWYDHSMEKKAVFNQLFDYSISKIRNAMEKRQGKGVPMVFINLDGVFLNTAPYYRYLLKSGELPSDDSWMKVEGTSTFLPNEGAVEFLQRLEEIGAVPYFFSTKRSGSNLETALKDFQRIGVQVNDPAQLIFSPSPEELLQLIGDLSSSGEAILMMTDDLSMVDPSFVDRQKKEVMMEVIRSGMGTMPFVIFPNPMGGSWEGMKGVQGPTDLEEYLKVKEEKAGQTRDY